MGNLKKIGNDRSLSQMAYSEIKRAIILNDIKPGQILTEEKLAGELGISRTPVRTAIKMLQNDNLVVINSSKNIIVSEFTAESVAEISEARIAVEHEVTGILAGKITDAQLLRIKEIYEQQIKSNQEKNVIEFIRLDNVFHKLINEYADNCWLSKIVDNLNDAYSRILILSGTTSDFGEIALEEHKAVIENLEKRDVEGAKKAMRVHLENVKIRMNQ